VFVFAKAQIPMLCGKREEAKLTVDTLCSAKKEAISESTILRKCTPLFAFQTLWANNPKCAYFAGLYLLLPYEPTNVQKLNSDQSEKEDKTLVITE
jgi:hypothetical protein